MQKKNYQWLGIILILVTGVLHLLTAQSEYEEAAYMGYVFLANFMCALLAAYGIHRDRLWGWLLGGLVAVGSIVGYIASRTVGMPGMQPETWLNAYGLTAMAVELLFLLLALTKPWAMSSENNTSAFFQRIMPAAAMFILALVGISAYRWDAILAAQVEPHQHIGTLAEVCSTPVTTFEELETRYGIRISLVAVSALDSIVDVRLKIIDPDKAHALLKDQAALLVDQQTLVLAPHLHTHAKLRPGTTFVMFFPTQGQTIQAGSEVNLVFGYVRIASVIVR